MNRHRLKEVFVNAREALLARRVSDHWEGHLSSSALSTATAVIALSVLARQRTAGNDPSFDPLIDRGVQWLAAHQNADGGWGDTAASPSNISTTVLGWAACSMAEDRHAAGAAANRAQPWIERLVGTSDPAAIADAITVRYGRDRTFAAPILLVCALSGRFGTDGWRFVPQLPFELAAVPRKWFSRLRLPVVSYALPALIAIGYARHRHRPSPNPIARAVRSMTAGRTLEVLDEIRPASGGFLEATPLTAFVVMSLAASGLRDHPVVEAGARFLVSSTRSDGSWPIDTNLATWVTTLAIESLPPEDDALGVSDRAAIRRWILRQQHRVVHRYTGAGPGGWAWTDLSGGVPDADDTAGALLALACLGPVDPVDDDARAAAVNGVRWLMDLQNADGGIPTFCRGWTKLPFDRSGPDLTAHALRAWAAWRDLPEVAQRLAPAARRALRYLAKTQRPDGAWTPLWFGNQRTVEQKNLTVGTSRVLTALDAAAAILDPSVARPIAARAQTWLMAAQNEDGGWGGDVNTPSSIEETALAVRALTVAGHDDDRVNRSIERGIAWLIASTEGGLVFPAAPIGLYFAKLWYSEELYPIIFTVAALRKALARTA